MKKIVILMVMAIVALASCGTMRNVPQSANKLHSPFPAVKGTEITFVENYVTYPLNASYTERVGKQAELKNDLRGELATTLYADVKTYNETQISRNAGDEEYSKDFLAWTLTTANMNFPADLVYTTEEEVRKGNTIYFWVRISADKKGMAKYYENAVKAKRKNLVDDVQAEHRHQENLARFSNN